MGISNSMVAHKWAHGNSGKGSNFSTDGKRLVSYSTLVGYNTGRGLVFISAYSMSPSTGRQLSHASRAVSHLDVVYTPYFQYGARLYDFDEKQAFSLACSAVSDQLEGFSIARLGKYLHSSMLRAIDHGADLIVLAARYGFDRPVIPVIPANKLEAARVYAEQWDIKDAQRREAQRVKAHAQQAAQREADADQFNRWHAGDTGARCPHSYRTDASGGYYIAVRDDSLVVTSGGAECPIEHARRGIAFWKSRDCKAGMPDRPLNMSGYDLPMFEPWQKNGHRVQLGVFQLDRIESDGTAYAGCHKFSVPELERLASILL